MKNYRCIWIILVLLVISSCLNRQFIDGRAELVSVSDTLLNDSSLIFGYIYGVDEINKASYPHYENEFEIWIENSKLRATIDKTGYYFIKTKPGTYSVKCQRPSNEWDTLIEEIKNIEIGKNKKTQIDFYIGYTIE